VLGARRRCRWDVGGRLQEPRFSGRGDRGEQRGESGRGWERGREEAPRRVGRLLPVKYGLQLWEASVLAGAREGGRGGEGRRTSEAEEIRKPWGHGLVGSPLALCPSGVTSRSMAGGVFSSSLGLYLVVVSIDLS